VVGETPLTAKTSLGLPRLAQTPLLPGPHGQLLGCCSPLSVLELPQYIVLYGYTCSLGFGAGVKILVIRPP